MAPSCVVGHAAFHLGVSLKKLDDWDSNGGPVGHLIEEGLFKVKAAERLRAEAYLVTLQSRQDHGATWRAARKAARLAVAKFDKLETPAARREFVANI